MRPLRLATALAVLCAAAPRGAAGQGQGADSVAPLVIGETITLQSDVLGEARRINVYFPPGFSAASTEPLPVLYMPDGGLAEDFLHVAGLVQVSVGNGTMRPFLLVGIENTERRRDMTGPTGNPDDRKIAPRVGGSAAFRAFLRTELRPMIRSRYRTTDESAIVGESLAGLFVVETFLLEPDLFDTYIAFDPSLWWNDSTLVTNAAALLARGDRSGKTIYLAYSDQPDLADLTRRFAATIDAVAPPGLRHELHQWAGETHGTIYHPAALLAFRTVFAPRH
ncbi:MAG: putative esterase [Gemmatimonadetes bacterium]|nr:putative esterase [Gemmatimonadota bacterium]